jgi:hypothetical protein
MHSNLITQDYGVDTESVAYQHFYLCGSTLGTGSTASAQSKLRSGASVQPLSTGCVYAPRQQISVRSVDFACYN